MSAGTLGRDTPPAVRVLVAELVAFRRNWRGWVMSSLGTPVAFLAAMGLGLGSLVDAGSAGGDLGVGYVVFVASGLMAASAMQNGYGEGAWPVMAGLEWRKHYAAMMATPLRPVDLYAGRLLWGTVNFAANLVAYAAIAVAFGALAPGPAALGILPATLTGVAFQAITTAYTAGLDNEAGLANAYRYGIMPLFLFSGTFFPVAQLPRLLEWVAVATPLYHGVELTRKVALQGPGPPVTSTMPAWVHVAYLAGVLALGWVLGVRRLRARLHA